MPATSVYFFQDAADRAPVLEWLRRLRARDAKAYAKCAARIRRLALEGQDLRRPEADYLRDGIYELRIRKGRVNYRILYLFHGPGVALLAHAITKEATLPAVETDRAVERKRLHETDPQHHTYREDVP